MPAGPQPPKWVTSEPWNAARIDGCFTAPGHPGVHLLGCFDRRITFHNQQVRALLSIRAMADLGRIQKGTQVAVVGGGAAGLTAALAAHRLGAHVDLYERETLLLSRQRSADHRWLHPHLYDWPIRSMTEHDAGLPLLNWKAGRASDVARNLDADFCNQFPEKNIYLGKQLDHIEKLAEDNYRLRFNRGAASNHAVVILAPGFGDDGGRRKPEISGDRTPDYWDIGDILHKQVVGKDVVVGGSGDGGLIDAVRAAVRDFVHHITVPSLLGGPEGLRLAEQMQRIDKVAAEEERKHRRPVEDLFQRYQKDLSILPVLLKSVRDLRKNAASVQLVSRVPGLFRLDTALVNRLLVFLLIEAGRIDFLDGEILPKEEGWALKRPSGKEERFPAAQLVLRRGPDPDYVKNTFSGAPWLIPADRRVESLELTRTLDQETWQFWADRPPTGPEAPALVPEVSGPCFFVPQLGESFPMVGRDLALQRVREALARGRTSIGQTAAFTGIGGIGKTRLALEYCHAERQRYPGGVYWFTADQNLDNQLLDLVKTAQWALPMVEAALKIKIATEQLQKIKDALVVYDNVEADVASLQPKVGEGNHILLTSRIEQAGYTRVNLDLLEEAESRTLLVGTAGRTVPAAEEEAVTRICSYLEGLPLALELAGAYLARYPERTWPEYAAQLEEEGFGPTAQRGAPTVRRGATHHEAILSKTLRVSRALFQEYQGLEDALDLLAWGAASSMSRDLIRALVEPTDWPSLRDGLEAVEKLKLIRREGSNRFRMHRLVQAVRREERPIDRPLAQRIMQRFAIWLEEHRKDFTNLPEYEAELDQIAQWAEVANRLNFPVEEVRLWWLRAYPDWHRGQYATSLSALDRAVRVYQERGLEDLLLKANLWSDRAVILWALGQLREALTLGQVALHIRVEKLGEQHRDTASSYDNLGGSYGALGNYSEALKYHERALVIRQEVLGEKHPDTATSYNNVGSTYGDLGKHSKALEYKEKALKIGKEVLGEAHPDTATWYNNVGSTYGDLGKHSKALEHKEKALNIRREVLGEAHPVTANSYNNVGCEYGNQNRTSEAIPHLVQSVEIANKTLGPNHPYTVRYVTNLTHSLKGTVLSEAHSLLRKVISSMSASKSRKDAVDEYNKALPDGFRKWNPTFPKK